MSAGSDGGQRVRGAVQYLEGASPVLGLVWKDFSYLPAACVDLAVGMVSPLLRAPHSPHLQKGPAAPTHPMAKA